MKRLLLLMTMIVLVPACTHYYYKPGQTSASFNRDKRECQRIAEKEAASFLKVSVVTLAKWRQKESGPAYTRTGRTIKYTREALECYLRKNVVESQR